MRVAFNTIYRSTIDDVNRAAQELTERQQEVSSGLRVRVPSDDPTATTVAIQEHDQLNAIGQYSSNADAALARLQVVDSVMSDMVTQVSVAKTAAAGAMSSIATPNQKQAAIATLQSVRDALVSDFNTSFHGSYIFSGSKATTAPYTQSAGGVVSAYQGDTNTMSIALDKQISVKSTFDASSIAQGSAATDVFTDIADLITAIQSGTLTDISAGMQKLDGAFDRVTSAQTALGIDEQTLTGQQARLVASQQASTTRLSKAQDANMAEAISGLAQATTAQQAALGAAATLNRASLFDYFK